MWPSGLRIRTPDCADPRDIDRMLAVMIEHERQFCDEPDVTRATLLGQVSGESALSDHHLMVLRAEACIGVVLAELDSAKQDVFIDVYAAPGEDPLITAALVTHGLAAAREVIGERSGWTVSSGCVVGDQVLADELTRAGFRNSRIFWRMIRNLADVPSRMPAAPVGVRLETARTPEQLGMLHRAYMASFAGHYGFTERTEEDYLQRITHGDGPTPERWWLAMAGDRAVGLCIQDDSRAEFDTAWVRTLGVIPEERGRGIARWLLECAFADAAARGMRDIGLTVDSDNSTGATRLYESIGMRSHLSIALWEQRVG